MPADPPERVPAAPETEPAGVASASSSATAQAAYERGDLRTLRAEQARGVELSAQHRAALTLDPMHIAVLAACTLGLFAIVLHYLGAHR